MSESAFGVQHAISKGIVTQMGSSYAKLPMVALKGAKNVKKNPKLLIPNELRRGKLRPL